MSNKDIKKGIAIQAKADADKVEKLARGLNAHRSVLSNLEAGQSEIRDAMGIVLDDMSAGEAKFLYDLQVRKTPDELDSTEKRVLCACIYTLLSSYNQNSHFQIEFYTNLEKYIGVNERKQNFDLLSLNNIDSHTDRLVILKAICSFLFLKEETFAFLKEKETFAWLFAFASVKDISDICSAINAEYAVLGVSGILGNYDPMLAPKKTMESKFYELASGEEEPDDIEQKPDEADCFQQLKKIIINSVSDEESFGKGVAFSEKDLKKELSPAFSSVAFDALIASSKIEKGFLFFTTHALYLKGGNIFNNQYSCLPYQSILADKMITMEGKQPGTRKLLIPWTADNVTNTLCIDDSKLQEEKLRDLIVSIAESKCDIAETDRVTALNDLNESVKRTLLPAIIYVLKKEKLPLVDVLLLCKDWGFDSDWDHLSACCENDDEYSRTVSTFIGQLPYPSKRVTSIEAANLILAFVTHANKLIGRVETSLSLNAETRILDFVPSGFDKKEFNLMVNQSVGKIKERPFGEYTELMVMLSNKEVQHKDLIVPYVKAIIDNKKGGLEHKAKSAMRETIKGVSRLASAAHQKVDGVQHSVRDNIGEIAQKALNKVKKAKDD